eukprot:g10403.t1
MKSRQRRMSKEWAKAREEGWDNTKGTRIKEYNALFDPNMRHFFETPSVQGHLLRTGQIDRNGRVIDFQKQKGKLHIIEQEFKQAERIEYWRQKEERDMRDRVQKKRALALERARKEEMVLRLHEDRLIRQEIVRAALAAQGGGSLRPGTSGSRGSSRSRSSSKSRRAGRRRSSWSEQNESVSGTMPETPGTLPGTTFTVEKGDHERERGAASYPGEYAQESSRSSAGVGWVGGGGGRGDGHANRCRSLETFVTEGGARRP